MCSIFLTLREPKQGNMAKDKRPNNKNKTSFKLGDKAAEKWTFEESEKVFKEILSKARDV